MTTALRRIPTEGQRLATFKQPMRPLIGGVSAIMAGKIGMELTAMSAISLSLDPSAVPLCLNRELRL
jgi:hypothetical protein